MAEEKTEHKNEYNNNNIVGLMVQFNKLTTAEKNELLERQFIAHPSFYYHSRQKETFLDSNIFCPHMEGGQYELPENITVTTNEGKYLVVRSTEYYKDSGYYSKEFVTDEATLFEIDLDAHNVYNPKELDAALYHYVLIYKGEVKTYALSYPILSLEYNKGLYAICEGDRSENDIEDTSSGDRCILFDEDDEIVSLYDLDPEDVYGSYPLYLRKRGFC